MSEFNATLAWERKTPEFTYETYDRTHTLTYGSGVTIESSAAPEYKGDPTKQNPEEAFLGAIMSCHMLTFLAIAAKSRFIVDRYEDSGSATLGKNEKGLLYVNKASIRPHVTFSGEKIPSFEQLKVLHEKSHLGCFIANSVLTDVTIEPVG